MPADRLNLSESQTLKIVRSSREALEVESTWQPSAKPPRTHWHPHQTERFEVREGELTVRIGAEQPCVVPAGASFDVPPRTAHAMWNAGPGPCRASWRISPARRTEEMFRTIDSRPGPLGLIRMLWTFRYEFRLGSPR